MNIRPDARAPAAALRPIFGIVFGSFLVMGLTIPVVPLFVHERLGLGTLAVGIVTGSQFMAQLASRVWAGKQADRRGPKRTIIIGLVANTASGLLSLLSLAFINRPMLSVGILLISRAVLGVSSAFAVTGAQTLGLALLGTGNTGKLMAQTGLATYSAYVLGAPLGTFAYGKFGFAALVTATIIIPLVTLPLALPLKAVSPQGAASGSVRTAVAAIWVPGLAMGLATVGFAAMMAFAPLLFASHGWASWAAFTAYAVAFMSARLFLGHLPDRAGGPRVAVYFTLCSATGQALLWGSSCFVLGLAGATLTGIGQALIYPSLGVEAIRNAPPYGRGLALGAFAAFYDLALGLASPALGFIGEVTGVASVFATSAVAALCSAGISLHLHRTRTVTATIQ